MVSKLLWGNVLNHKRVWSKLYSMKIIYWLSEFSHRCIILTSTVYKHPSYYCFIMSNPWSLYVRKYGWVVKRFKFHHDNRFDYSILVRCFWQKERISSHRLGQCWRGAFEKRGDKFLPSSRSILTWCCWWKKRVPPIASINFNVVLLAKEETRSSHRHNQCWRGAFGRRRGVPPIFSAKNWVFRQSECVLPPDSTTLWSTLWRCYWQARISLLSTSG